MRIKYKIMVGAAMLSTVPVLIASLAIGGLATDRSRQALEEAAKSRLVALRDAKKAQVSDYFQTIQNQVLSLSRSNTVIEAMGIFSRSVKSYRQELFKPDIAQFRNKLADYYSKEYKAEYSRRNAGEEIDVAGLLQKLDDDAIALQYQYIGVNPNPLGEKDKLEDPVDGSQYGNWHALFHPYFKDFQRRFGYYDLFLADAETGRIVYSVFKELDFATSLKEGPYSDSGIGEVFRKANQATTTEFVALSDFAPYVPSYQDSAAFIASPIFDEKGNRTGVLIFQMPIDRINAMMTQNGHWQEAGLGSTGETYLVGPDTRMRSISRFLVEDRAGYLQAISHAQIDTRTVELIKAKQTNIGLHPVATEGSREALAGHSGFSIFSDFRDISVLSAYAPIQVGSRNWAILAEIDKAEAFAASDQLSRQLLTIAAAICAVLIVLAAGVGVWFAGSLSRPILKLSGTIGEIERESDLTRQVDIRSQDELGMVANAFNTMVVKFRDSIRQVADATSQLAATAEETSVITQQTSQTAQSQQAETAQVATAMTEMNATVQEVANNTQITSQAASDVTREAIQGRQAMEQTVEQIQQLADEVEKAAEVVGGLEKNSQEIGAVLDVIKGIAEQTNLLALNAAIEAARAGEQGRGFAVVADEVRTLASRTQQSTEEINKMIEKLQVGSRQAVTAMGQSREKTQQAVKQALETGQSLSTITAAIERINDMSTQIASAAEEQSAVTGEISRNIVQISEMTEQTAVGAQQTSEASVELSRLANGLQALVARFKIQASADC